MGLVCHFNHTHKLFESTTLHPKMSDESKCPVDPRTRDIWLQKSKEAQKAQEQRLNTQQEKQLILSKETSTWTWMNLLWAPKPTSCPIPQVNASGGCPVPHSSGTNIPEGHPSVNGLAITTSEPESIECNSKEIDQGLTTPPNAVSGSKLLSEQREISSIPRTNVDSNWVYPSEKQFFNAMLRKNWTPEEKDMKTVVPLHNLVNEVTWKYILNWEKGQGSCGCEDIKLTSFKGDSKKITPRAAIGHYIFGRDLPFDRHDWVVNRCGKEVEYVIDFYTTPVKEGEEPRFFLDVRPKLNSLEGCGMRLYRALGL